MERYTTSELVFINVKYDKKNLVQKHRFPHSFTSNFLHFKWLLERLAVNPSRVQGGREGREQYKRIMFLLLSHLYIFQWRVSLIMLAWILNALRTKNLGHYNNRLVGNYRSYTKLRPWVPGRHVPGLWTLNETSTLGTSRHVTESRTKLRPWVPSRLVIGSWIMNEASSLGTEQPSDRIMNHERSFETGYRATKWLDHVFIVFIKAPHPESHIYVVIMFLNQRRPPPLAVNQTYTILCLTQR